MKTTLRSALAAAVLALSVACGASDLASTLGQQAAPSGNQPPACATLLVRALTTPSAVVHGSFACQDAALQQRAKAAGVSTDADLQSIAQSPPIYAHPQLLGRMPDGGWEWGVSIDTGSAVQHGHIFVWTDPDGKVSMVGLL